ncbi:helix-turn-helix domain-containing protein [Vibrio sp. YIC-376]|uniref:helix-turn-helix domain-containing protein n=1 Tax=Vibrio sp. YIC-376 TaxID=3136162 RepID=UPI00402A8B8B
MVASSMMFNISGIHSKQPWFVLSSEQFLTRLSTNNPEVSHFYSFIAGRSEYPTTAIPDGCIDIVFDCDADTSGALVCGTRVEASSVLFERGHRYFGVRFTPGVKPDFLQASASELTNKEYCLQDVMPHSNELIDYVLEAKDFSKQVDAVSQFLNTKSPRNSTNVTQQVVAKICLHKGNIQVQELERFSGYTSRTLQRMFKNDIGLTPKGFSRAIRCQSAIYDINHCEKLTFSDLASTLGFSDQPHFLREFKKLVNVTPLEYQNRVKEKTYLERIHCY